MSQLEKMPQICYLSSNLTAIHFPQTFPISIYIEMGKLLPDQMMICIDLRRYLNQWQGPRIADHLGLIAYRKLFSFLLIHSHLIKWWSEKIFKDVSICGEDPAWAEVARCLSIGGDVTKLSMSVLILTMSVLILISVTRRYRSDVRYSLTY